METIIFQGFPKIARLSRECIITEKIDGTNAQIYIADDMQPIILESGRIVPFLCGSRTRWIFPEFDNYGFATWAYSNATDLLKLGPGRHFGEWWGQGIQRNYNLKEKRFSLFNAVHWNEKNLPKGCFTVPILYKGLFESSAIMNCLDMLNKIGSFAAPGFMQAEGIVIYHIAANIGFKKTIKNDDIPKGLQ